MIPFAIALPF